MKPQILTAAALLTTISLTTPAKAEDLAQISQLLNTKQCVQCDLSGAGLVLARLSNAQLTQTNLTRANLSRADLSGADLRGANLTGTSLNGANLTGADLRGAILNGTDLRDAYLFDAKLEDTSLASAYIQGTIGIPLDAASAEQFNVWGVMEANRQNYAAALEHYNKALALDPELAAAYLGSAWTLYRLRDEEEAIKNATIASTLFEEQGNVKGKETSDQFLVSIEEARQAAENRNSGGSGGGVGRFLGGVLSFLLQVLL